MDLILSFRSYFLRKNRELVTIDDFVQYLEGFQNIIYLIAETKNPSMNVKDFRFLVKEILPGSMNCSIESYSRSRDLMGSDPIENVMELFRQISVLMESSDDEDTYKRFVQIIEPPNKRISLYTQFDKIIVNENNAFQIYIQDGKYSEPLKIYSSKSRYRHRINVWRKLDRKPMMKEFIGVVKNLNAYFESKKFMKMVGPDGEKIKYYYKEAEQEEIIKLYNRNIIKVKGLYNHSSKIITHLKTMDKIESETFNKLKNIEFSHPITIKLTLEYGYIHGSNAEFDLYASGETYNKMLDDLYTRIAGLIDILKDSEIKFTESSLSYRKKFLETFIKKER